MPMVQHVFYLCPDSGPPMHQHFVVLLWGFHVQQETNSKRNQPTTKQHKWDVICLAFGECKRRNSEEITGYPRNIVWLIVLFCLGLCYMANRYNHADQSQSTYVVARTLIVGETICNGWIHPVWNMICWFYLLLTYHAWYMYVIVCV